MKTPRTEQSNMNEHSATTTEELIVQYLDGELHRKELESVLFGRLAVSEDARTMMHEHLLMRGAIRASGESERFQLSESLDRKARTRIEQVLKVMTPAEGVVFAEDAPLIRTNLVTRRIKNYSLRPSLAFLALLLAIGTTWFVTRPTEQPVAVNASARPMAVPAAQQPAAPTEQSTPAEIAALAPTPVEAVHPVSVQKVRSTPTATPANLTQNTSVAPKTEIKTEEPDPADVMLSKRYAKMLNATEKREVVVGNHDRL
jgi:hypothetical protein